jgi:hypothetical protein
MTGRRDEQRLRKRLAEFRDDQWFKRRYRDDDISD